MYVYAWLFHYRFANASECKSEHCKRQNYREHFHCMNCDSKVFVKKEEMIRHFKWHSKRDEFLRSGFLRFSTCDDCSEKFPNCPHRLKQTHYHCLKKACPKVRHTFVPFLRPFYTLAVYTAWLMAYVLSSTNVFNTMLTLSQYHFKWWTVILCKQQRAERWR